MRGVFDATLAPDQLMPSDYYSNDERFEVTGKRGFVRVNHCTAHGLRQPSLEVYRDAEDARDVLGFLMASVESSKQNRRVRLDDAQPE